MEAVAREFAVDAQVASRSVSAGAQEPDQTVTTDDDLANDPWIQAKKFQQSLLTWERVKWPLEPTLKGPRP